jgi:hypothetical protein
MKFGATQSLNNAGTVQELLRLFSFEPLHRGALEFPVGVALLDILAFIELHFAFANAQQNFHATILPVHREWEERVALH